MTSPTATTVRGGLRRLRVELRLLFTNPEDLVGLLFGPIVMLIVLFLMRDSSYSGTDLSLGALALPSVLGMTVAFNGLYGIAQHLTLDREDGALLRAKATPHGIGAYLIGKLGVSAAAVGVQLIILLGVGMLIVSGVAPAGAAGWLTLLWVLVLGLAAMLSLGAVLGSLFENPRALFFVTIPLLALIAISGIFYPIAALPGWLQVVAQVFPIYWLGLGMRSALLPDTTAAIEIDGSWRHLETAAVLGIWAVVLLAIAPVVLRRMARHESGARVMARREKALSSAY